MGFQNGLSGLNAAAQNLDVIGHNVANVNTIGAKSSRTSFADIYATSMFGSGSGLGVQVAGVTQQFAQGALASSDNPLDMAVNGSGFFVVSKGGVDSYTRNGEFRRDTENYLTTIDGARLKGYAADANGNIQAGGTPSELQLSTGSISPKKTTMAELGINLDSREVAPTAAFSITDPESYNSATTTRVYDTQGNPHQFTTYFRKTADNTWEVQGSLDGGAPALVGTGLTFDANGILTAGATANASFVIPGGAQTPLDFTVDFSALTQFGSGFSVTKQVQDGFAPGEVAGYSISGDGTILAKYTNGETKAMGQVALANFANPQGLSPQGGNIWSETMESGQAMIGSPGSGPLGTLKSGALESSNIDLTEELVNMITAQRTYQANAQTIKTQDQIMQTLINLR